MALTIYSACKAYMYIVYLYTFIFRLQDQTKNITTSNFYLAVCYNKFGRLPLPPPPKKKEYSQVGCSSDT